MLRHPRAWIRERRERRSREYVAGEDVRRRAQQERYEAERRIAEERQRINSGPPDLPGSWGA